MGVDGSQAGFKYRSAAIVSLLLLGGFLVYWFTRDTAGDAAAPETSADARAPRAAQSEPTPRLRRVQADPVEAPAGPDDGIPLASQPLEGASLGMMKQPLVCDITPATAGPAVEGAVETLTWPGPDHEPREGGMDAPTFTTRVTIEASTMTGTLTLVVDRSNVGPVRHAARLAVPGYAPTDFSFVTSGPDQPVVCEGPIALKLAENGVVGTVRLSDGSPAEGAIVSGCKAAAVTGSDGDYFLLPRADEPCSLRARHAPGTAVQSPPTEIDPLAQDDQVVDFTVVPPDRPTPGVEITRDEAGEVWVKAESPAAPWDRHLRYSALLLRIGDVPASSLDDDELRRALVQLDRDIHLQHQFYSADGEEVLRNSVVDEL